MYYYCSLHVLACSNVVGRLLRHPGIVTAIVMLVCLYIEGQSISGQVALGQPRKVLASFGTLLAIEM